MKKYMMIGAIALILPVLLTGFFIACSSGGGGSEAGSNTITVTGSFSGGTQANNLGPNRFVKWMFPIAHALNPNDISKAIAFQGDGDYFISTVSNSSFSVTIEKGSPVGIIFMGASNNYLGYLSLKNGIDSLPLTALSSGVSTIDLQTLSSSGLIVEPSHNPIGAELSLTADEQTAVAHGDDFFVSVIKNPDVDGDGTIDFLSGKFYLPFIVYFISGGNFGGNLTPTVNSPANISSYGFSFHANDTNSDANFPATVYFTGPLGSGLSNSANDYAPIVQADSAVYGSPHISSPLIPPAGQYTVAYKTSTLTFNIPDQSLATSNTVIAVPTLTLNDNGTIQKVNWNYKMGSAASTTLTPQSIISSIELQVEGGGTPCATYPQAGRIYNSGMLSAATTEHVLGCQNLAWSDVTQIHMSYNDVYGNHNVVTWNK